MKVINRLIYSDGHLTLYEDGSMVVVGDKAEIMRFELRRSGDKGKDSLNKIFNILKGINNGI